MVQFLLYRLVIGSLLTQYFLLTVACNCLINSSCNLKKRNLRCLLVLMYTTKLLNDLFLLSKTYIEKFVSRSRPLKVLEKSEHKKGSMRKYVGFTFF